MQKITLLLVANLVAMVAGAQLMDMQTQLYFTRLTTNPALTAYNGSTNVHGFFRDQWSGVANHPRIGGAVGEISLWKDRIGTGLEVMAYSAGVSKIIDAKIYYAQKLKLAPDHSLSIGVAAGILQHNNSYDPNSATELVNDINFSQPANMLFDLNIGLAYQWKKLTLGFAIPNLLDGNARVYNNLTKLSGFNRNYIINGSYEINLAQGKFNLEPLVVFRVDQNKAFNMKMQVMADYKKIVFLGAGYNLYGGVPITAGVRISKIFTLAYGYQVPVMRNIPTTGIYSTHEVMISVCFDKWMKKADKVKDIAAAPQQSDYDSLLSRKASADSLAATQKAVDSLAQKLEALQLALDNAQQQAAETAAQKSEQEAALAAQKKEQEAKLEALQKQIETRAEQQKKETAQQKAEPARQEEAAPVAKKQTTIPDKTQPLATEAKSFDQEIENKKDPAAGDRFRLEQVSFERNGSELNEQSYNQLDKLVAYLKAHPTTRVRISGHTDNRASEEYNGWLSRLRAKAVVEYLKQKGISPNRITAVGMGPSVPVAGNETDEGRAKNRRVEVEFIK